MEKRQKFSAQFNREAAHQLRESVKPASVIARELGIPRNGIYNLATDLDQQTQRNFQAMVASRQHKMSWVTSFF